MSWLVKYSYRYLCFWEMHLCRNVFLHIGHYSVFSPCKSHFPKSWLFKLTDSFTLISDIMLMTSHTKWTFCRPPLWYLFIKCLIDHTSENNPPLASIFNPLQKKLLRNPATVKDHRDSMFFNHLSSMCSYSTSLRICPKMWGLDHSHTPCWDVSCQLAD